MRGCQPHSPGGSAMSSVDEKAHADSHGRVCARRPAAQPGRPQKPRGHGILHDLSLSARTGTEAIGSRVLTAF